MARQKQTKSGDKERQRREEASFAGAGFSVADVIKRRAKAAKKKSRNAASEGMIGDAEPVATHEDPANPAPAVVSDRTLSDEELRQALGGLSDQQLHRLLKETGRELEPARQLRRAAERPAPDLPSTAEVNRQLKQVKYRTIEQLAGAIRRAAAEADETQSGFINRAVIARLKAEFPEIYEELRSQESEFPELRPRARPGIDFN